VKITTSLLYDLLSSYFKSRGLKDNTIARKFQELRRFLEYIENNDFDLRSLNSTDIEDYILSLKKICVQYSKSS